MNSTFYHITIKPGLKDKLQNTYPIFKSPVNKRLRRLEIIFVHFVARNLNGDNFTIFK